MKGLLNFSSIGETQIWDGLFNMVTSSSCNFIISMVIFFSMRMNNLRKLGIQMISSWDQSFTLLLITPMQYLPHPKELFTCMSIRPSKWTSSYWIHFPYHKKHQLYLKQPNSHWVVARMKFYVWKISYSVNYLQWDREVMVYHWLMWV